MRTPQSSSHTEATATATVTVTATATLPSRTILPTAIGALVTALAAGVAETIAQLWPWADIGADAPAILLRLGIYAIVGWLIVMLARGHRWATFTLIFGLGVVGTASLIIGPVSWLFTDGDFAALFASADARLVTIMIARTIHLIAVVVAVTLMVNLLGRPRLHTEPAEQTTPTP